MSDEKKKAAIARKSLNYKAGLKKAIHSGDFMELCQVLIKYRETFGSDEGFGDILSVLQGGIED